MTGEPQQEQDARAETPPNPGGGRLRLFGERGVAATREGIARLGRQRLLALGLVLVLLLSPWPPLTIATLLAYAAVTFKTPGVTTALIPLTFPFAYRPKDFYGPVFPVVELLLLIALATSGLQLLLAWQRAARAGTGSAAILDFWDETKRVLGGPFGLQAAALALIATFSLFTVADGAHLRESLREYRTVVIEPLLYFFIARHWLRSRDLRQLAIGAFVGGATLVALLALGQVTTGQNVVVAEGVRRALGTYAHPNALALYLERVVAFAAALAVLAGWQRRSVPLLVSLPIIGAALLLTFSRGAFTGLAVALAVLCAYALTHRDTASKAAKNPFTTQTAPTGAFAKALPAIGAVATAALILAVVAVGITAIRSGSDSLGLRQLIWGAALAMIRDHPAFGVGLDQFIYQYAPRYIDPAAWEERFTSHPHNLFLDFWVRLGIMGLAWVGWTLSSLALRLVRAWTPPMVATLPPKAGRKATAIAPATEATPDDVRRVLIAAGIACVAAFTHGLLDNFYFLIDLAFVWWLLLALVQIGAERWVGEPTEGW